MVITTAQLYSFKPGFRFCTCLNPARDVSEIYDGENLWLRLRLEIRLNTFRWSTIPGKQFIKTIYFNKAYLCLHQSVFQKLIQLAFRAWACFKHWICFSVISYYSHWKHWVSSLIRQCNVSRMSNLDRASTDICKCLPSLLHFLF